MKNQGLISGLVLLTLGLVCGLLLAFVNELTVDKIAEEELRLKFAAISEFYNIDEFKLEEVEIDGGSIYVLRDQSDNGIEHLVYSLSATGYGDEIEMLVAVNEDLSVQGYTVTYQNETPGIGTRIVGYDFNFHTANDLETFDGVSGASVSSGGVKAIFEQVADRVEGDFGGNLDE